ncbi:S8 family serine peptidase [Vreelandella rituensis]|uniref:Peptidase S8 n=1 Tax=Vreelandella rituensis TaxID=2282306 RepID=A0A368U9B6_9GAMM|nr:S8 family serine peptidase [Halomonas rituensis]RCV93809.1 peptidase S8 [Halomonas rituensis]
MKKQPLAIAIAIASTSIILTGCGGGGGGGGGTKPTDDSGLHEYTPEEPSTPTYDLQAVRVAVVDGGFDKDAIDNKERIIDSYSILTEESDVLSDNPWHGNVVASTVTLDPLGNSRLDLIKISNGDGAVDSQALRYGVGVAADRGARVVNLSFRANLSDPTPHPHWSYNGVTSAESLNKIVTSNGGLGTVFVQSAGNDGRVMEVPSEQPIYDNQEMFSRMLFAGGSIDDGADIHPDSNHPGDDTHLQSRFLTAPYINSEVGASGTSIAAPQISAYAAGIIGMWPHMNAQQASQLLLDTASRHSALYERNDCGAGGTTNCGAYFMGQGEADIHAALAPQGEVSVASGSQVAAGGHLPTESVAQLSGAYGDAMASSAALQDVTVFDDLGRDYALDMSGNAAPRDNRAALMRNNMDRLSITSNQMRHMSHNEAGMFSFGTVQNNFGDVLASRFDGTFGNAMLTAYHYAGGEVDPLSSYAESGMMPMLSFQGGADITRSMEAVAGVKSEYALGARTSLIAAHWNGSVDNDAASLLSDYSANRSDVGLSYQLSPAMSLTTTLGVLNESNGLLGAQGAGAMSFGDSNRMTFAGLSMDYQMADNFSAFAQFEQAQGSASGNGLISSIDNIRAQEMAAGFQWNSGIQQAALTFRQPMRIDSADATFNVPVGRTLAGDVIRENREASLSPSGRQMDIEFGYTVKPSARSQLQINLLHSLEPGHDADAKSDTAAMLNYSIDI